MFKKGVNNSKSGKQPPSVRQKLAFKRLVEKGGSVSAGMRAVGYSPATAKTPSKLTKSRSWNQLMDQYISDDLLSKVHNEQLQATRPVIIGKTIIKMFPDNDARNKAVDMGYKLKAKYTPEQIELTKRKYQDLNNKDLAERLVVLKKFLLKK